MRISVIAGDPDRVMNLVDYRVTLDGVEQRDCLVADADKGMILRYKHNRMGLLYANRQGKMETEELHGNVVIEQTHLRSAHCENETSQLYP